MDKEKIVVAPETLDEIKILKASAEALNITLTEYLMYKTYKKIDNIEKLVDNIEYHSEKIDENTKNIYFNMPE